MSDVFDEVISRLNHLEDTDLEWKDLKSFIEFKQKNRGIFAKFGLCIHRWVRIGGMWRCHEPTWSVYYAERPWFRACIKCGRVEEWDTDSLSYKSVDDLNRIPDDFPVLPYYEETELESPEVRRMYGQA